MLTSKLLLMIALLPVAVDAQVVAPKAPPAVVAGIPANYDEAKVGTYTLPDALVLNNGKRVMDAKTWVAKRRPEIVAMFEEQQFGRAPGRPVDERFEVLDQGTLALGGKALRKQITIHLVKDPAAPVIHLLLYTPADAKKPVPLLLAINFSANSATVDDPGILPDKVWDAKTHTRVATTPGKALQKLNVEAVLNAHMGIATFYYGDLVPDDLEGFSEGIQQWFLKPGQTRPGPSEWGSIAAWAWGMSRAQDYLETDKDVDAKRVAIHGISRLGKTVMWAGAHDQRFAAVIESCSGEGGSALSRRDYGETVGHLTAPGRYGYQFAANYAQYGKHVDQMPMDAHMLIALVAPRPLLLQTGTTDYWSDPKGEFLAAVAAGPVYRLLGKDPLDTEVWPAANQPLLHDIGYFMHEGGHGTIESDWDVFVRFLKMKLRPES